MSETIRINTEEYNEEFSRKLKVGDSVLITGKIYSARDAAHKVMTEALARGEKLPIDWTNKFVYYLGPTPAKPGDPIGSAGPTTSGRMDAYTPTMLDQGIKGMIGKGAVGLHLFAQRFRQIDIKTHDLVAGIQRFKRRIGGGDAEIDFIRSGCASGEGGE